MKSLIFLFIAIIANLPFVLLSIPFRCVDDPPDTSTIPEMLLVLNQHVTSPSMLAAH
jgi:hypothetical protein